MGIRKDYTHLAGLLLAGLLLATACEDADGLDVVEIDVPEQYALSAGTSTVFINSSFAYDTEASWVSASATASRRFIRGDGLYDDARTQGDGLGPVYAGYSCGSCHRNAGRTKPALWTQAGTAADATHVCGAGTFG